MALVPIIQPPIIRALTTKREREIVMPQVQPVSGKVRILFPIVTTIAAALLVPASAPLIGMLMLGNLFREAGVVDRLSKTAQNELINIVTIFLGLSVGSKMAAESFLTLSTILIIVLGLLAFAIGTSAGVLLGKLMCLLTGGRINPMIGASGVSAVPMSARVVQKEGQRANPHSFLLMNAMGPNVAGVIGSAVAAGVLLALAGK
jgi:oxaloacetate decarboxylase beta subunit